jgi:hypothetical protein
VTNPIVTADNTRSPKWRRRSWLAAGVAALVLAAGGGYTMATAGQHHSADSGQQATAARAAAVMPFDLNATVHTFTKTDTGGVEQVVANAPDDQRNITSIREHLSKEANQFAKGDYGDPATIHGTTMPGLQELQAGAARVDVRYEQVTSGARITYSSTDPALVTALHAWFDAQNHDHAMPGMGMGH